MNEDEYYQYEIRQRRKEKSETYDSPHRRLNSMVNHMGKMKDIVIMLEEGKGTEEIGNYIYETNTDLSLGEAMQIAHTLVIQYQSPI